MKLTYITDKSRHLVCIPYSIENLHQMAEELNIKRCWFHKHHYDIPKTRIEEIEKKCKHLSTKHIIDIIKRPDLAHDLLSECNYNFAKPKGIGFEVTQMKYKGTVD